MPPRSEFRQRWNYFLAHYFLVVKRSASNRIKIVLKEGSHRQKFNGNFLFFRVSIHIQILEKPVYKLDRTLHVDKVPKHLWGPRTSLRTPRVEIWLIECSHIAPACVSTSKHFRTTSSIWTLPVKKDPACQ